MRKLSSVRKANSGLHMRRDNNAAAWRSQYGSGKLPDRGVRSLADSTFNPGASLGLRLRTAGEANGQMVEGGGWSVTGDQPGDADAAACACHFFPSPFERVPASPD